jgi:hypothetical protein
MGLSHQVMLASSGLNGVFMAGKFDFESRDAIGFHLHSTINNTELKETGVGTLNRPEKWRN